jgi:transposase
MHIATVTKTDSQGRKRNYYRLCESYRTADGQPRKRMLCALGYLEELPTLKEQMLLLRCIEDIAYRGQRPMSGNPLIDSLTYKYYDHIVKSGKLTEIKGLMEEYRLSLERRGIERVNLSTMENVDPREVGAEHVCLSTLKRLGLEAFLLRQGWDAADALFAVMQIASRAIYPVSELKTVSYLRENSALCELTGIDPGKVSHTRLYRSALRLYNEHEKLEDYLHERVCNMFDIKEEVILFDLTNTYFEGRMQNSRIARFGRSKEKRSDCRLVVLAAVVNTDGLLIRTRIFEGNRGDCTTLKEIIASLEESMKKQGKSKEDITVVMDAGISTKENLAYLKAEGYHYVTVARSGGLKYSSMGEGIRTVRDNKDQEIRLEKIRIEDCSDTALLVDSKAKNAKEQAMYERACQYYEEGLQAIATGIGKKGGTKKLEKVSERLGRLKAASPSVWKDYEVRCEYNEKNVVTCFEWKRDVSKSLTRESKHGKYVLRTDLDETKEEVIWEFYNVIRMVESTFRCLKTDLDLRPVYHKGDDGTKAHLHLAVLAYWVVSVIEYQLRKKGICHPWGEIRRILSTQKVVSTRVEREDHAIVDIRQCSEPSEEVSRLYQVLDIREKPIKRRKFVVHPKVPPD